ncbi:MAG: radical SAM protein [Archaeoglobaceae archaeon]|nr:radical SAM protein [Archaeoglobales archaeon]MDI9642622.1 radical SAM protein [Archaeoglobales archaeon]
MISLSKLVGGSSTVSKKLTYGDEEVFIPRKLVEFSSALIPIVVWNITDRCNLKCVHCYAKTGFRAKELSTEECKRIITELAEFKVPLILFSGGEPLMREDIFEIAEFAKKKNIKVVLSTNGTLIDKDTAEELKVFDYVGISLDGVKIHDKFRGMDGAFETSLNALKISNEVVMTGVRFTLTKYNFLELPELLNLARENEISRFCLYHLVPSGNASFKDDVDNIIRKRVIDYMISQAEREGMEILTVDNPSDGIYVYQKTKDERVLEFLKYRGGDNSGVRLVCIDPEGNVHPNQFWRDYNAGNLLKRSFKEIWIKDPLFKMLRDKGKFLRDRCGICKYKDLCGGLRIRAYRSGDLWGWDPSCYVSYA